MANEAKHTPGPYKVGGFQQNVRVSGPRIVGPGNETVAIVVSGSGRASWTADLLAAAPSLAEAVKSLLSVMSDVEAASEMSDRAASHYKPTHFKAAFADARAALTKAGL